MRTSFLPSVAWLCSAVIAQQVDGPQSPATAKPAAQITNDPPALPTPSVSMSARDLFVPIHTQEADPIGGIYGWWTASGSYKASFHDGFTFYPYLGPDYPENLPFAWRNTRVQIGNQVLVAEGATPQHSHSDYRYEYRHAGVTEAYDVRIDGVEQTFTISQKPTASGALVIRGDVQSKLRAAAVASAHQKLTFKDAENKDHVVYGEAYAIDALGKKTTVATAFDGSTITLTVDAATVANAAYPLTIDPLTTAVVISTWGGATFGLPSYPAVGRDDESLTKNIMTFYARQFSATDFDGYARLTDNDFSNTGQVYTDVTTSWSTGKAGVASVGGSNRWTLCLERDFGGTTQSWIRVYVHDFLNTTLNSGTTLFITQTSGSQTRRNPEIGGTRSFSTGTKALCVYQQDTTTNNSNTSATEVYGILIDAGNTVGPVAPSFGTPFRLDTVAVGTTYDREYPGVNQESNGGTASWVVVWQEYNNTITGDDWDILCARVTPAGVTTGSQGTVNNLGNTGGTANKKRPRVAGREGRYLATFITGTSLTSDLGTDVETHRFNWAETSNLNTKLQRRVLATSTTADFVNGQVAYDTISDSHWAVIYQRGGYTTSDLFVARLGYTGGVVEAQTVYAAASTGGYSPSITFDDDSRAFLLVYATTENPPSGYPVYGRTFTYPTTALSVAYGTSCGGGIGSTTPNAGNEFFSVALAAGAADANRVAALFVGSAPAAIALAPYGLGSCFLNMPTILVTLNTTTDASGNAAFVLPLPDAPVAIGDVYMQWLYASPSAPWVLKYRLTSGLRVQIR